MLLDLGSRIYRPDESEEIFVSETHYYLDLISRLLGTGMYEWARETLEGIHATVTRTGNLTPRQKQAIDHIMVGRLKHDIGPDGGMR